MTAVVARARTRYLRLRRETPLLDLVLRISERYSRMGGRQQAAAITYYGFLSFFPVLALAFAAVGVIDSIWPDADDALADAINQVMPGLVGAGEGQISIDQVQHLSGWAGVLGLLGVIWAGTYWVTSLRTAMYLLFDVPAAERPSYVVAKLSDVLALAVLGGTLMVSVVGAGILTTFSEQISDRIGWSSPVLLDLLTRVVAWLVSLALFYVIFRMVGRPHVPQRSLWEGAALGALVFEGMKALSFLILSSVQGSPAFQAFGISIVVLVWLNYFSKVIFYAGCYACEIRPDRSPPCKESPMKLEKKHAWLLIGVGIWNFWVWGTFIRNLAAAHARGEQHPDAYYIAHTVLIIVDLLIGAALLWLGIKALRAAKRADARAVRA